MENVHSVEIHHKGEHTTVLAGNDNKPDTMNGSKLPDAAYILPEKLTLKEN